MNKPPFKVKCIDDYSLDLTRGKEYTVLRNDDGCTYPYMNNCLAYQNAFAIDDNGNEITSA